jgi:pimeloyl-ACP methyl ester carboxylesterase
MYVGGGHDRRECLRIVPFFNAAGYPALLYDNSEHGISDGDGYGLGFGYREKMDLIGAVQYAKRELGWDKIVVFGTSVGAATTLKAAALDPRIDAVVAENPFTSAEDLWKYAIRRALGTAGFGGRDISRFGKAAELIMKIGPLIPESFFDLVVWLTKWRIGALGHPNTIDIVDKISPRPILLIHSKADDVIPYQHSGTRSICHIAKFVHYPHSLLTTAEALYAKAGQPKEIYITETGSHAAVYNDHKEEFTRKVLTFVKKAIGENKVAEPTKTPSSPASA